jgi:ABC-type oligopeptide transport system substrate-binding subunit
MKKFFFFFLLCVVMLIVVACGGSSTERDSRLVGTLNSTVDNFSYVLNENGTGRRGVPGLMENITWETENNDTFLVTVDGITELWSYTVSGSNISFTSAMFPGVEFPFRRQ